MPYRRLLTTLASACVALVALDAAQTATRQAQGSATAARPRTERRVPFGPGETLTYDVSWSNYLTAGTATVSVREKRASYGSTAYYVVAEGKPTPLLSKLYTLYYKADTLLDVYSLLPQRSSIYSDEGGRKRMKTTQFNQDERTASYEVQTATLVKRQIRLAPYTQDPLSAILVVRALPMKPGAKLNIPVADSGELMKVQITVGNREPVRTGLGTVQGWKVVPAIFDANGRPESTRRMALWISDDARKLPLKLQAELPVGNFNLVLRSASGGQ